MKVMAKREVMLREVKVKREVEVRREVVEEARRRLRSNQRHAFQLIGQSSNRTEQSAVASKS